VEVDRSEDAEQRTQADQLSERQRLRGPGALTLEVCAPVISILMEYAPEYGPGAQLKPYSWCCQKPSSCVGPCPGRSGVLLNVSHHHCSDQPSSKQRELSDPDAHAGRTLLSWTCCRTFLPAGCAVLRLEANRLSCNAEDQLTPSGAPSQRPRTRNPVQLLCRALSLAPECYRRFEVTAKSPDEPLQVDSSVLLPSGVSETYPGMRFGTVAALAAAMGQFAAIERLSVHMSADERSIVVHKFNDQASSSCA